jgi:hypothetical protein
MAGDFRITGTEQMRLLGKQLRDAGRKDLVVELKKEINRHARDAQIKDLIADSAREMLPSGGGGERKPRPSGPRKDGKKRVPRARSRKKRLALNEFVAKQKVVVKTNLGGRNIGVRIQGSKAKAGKQVDLNAINRGRVKHPTFGHKPWVIQEVEPGYFDKPLEGPVADDFRRAIFAAINNIRQQLLAGGKSGSRAA